jgi:hypothetical protein
MKKQILLFFGFIFICANVSSAQSKRTVTNADLERFRQTRLQAERDYRENYQRLGLPSPEELEKQREKNRNELSELSERLREENLEREQRQREEEFRQAQILYFRSGSQFNQGAYNGNGYYSSGFVGGYPYFGYSSGYNGNYYNNRFGKKRGFGRGGNFYNPIFPGVGFPSQGVRINTNGVRINTTRGNRHPAPIRNPR